MQVDVIDIAAEPEDKKNYKKEEDPTLVKSEKADRGPLTPGWQKKKPLMCAYKLVTAEFKMWGFQGKVESFLMKVLVYHHTLMCHLFVLIFMAV